MSYNYRGISNNPSERSILIYPWCYWDDMFTDEELNELCEYFSKHGVDRAITVGQDNLDSANLEIEISDENSPRKSKIKFHSYDENTDWFFRKINYAIEQINNKFYNFDLNGYDHVQYTEYDEHELGKYDFHIDTIMDKAVQHEVRKLSLIMLLNTPEVDFEGGEFEINIGQEKNAIKVDAKRGRIIAFPSFMIHRVKPVTKGKRKSLVTWVLGPKFR